MEAALSRGGLWFCACALRLSASRGAAEAAADGAEGDREEGVAVRELLSVFKNPKMLNAPFAEEAGGKLGVSSGWGWREAGG